MITLRILNAVPVQPVSSSCSLDRRDYRARSVPFRRPRPGHWTDMFPAENLRDWRDEKVIDPAGSKIGDLEAVYVDTTTDEPAFLTVKVGMIGRHRLVFV